MIQRINRLRSFGIYRDFNGDAQTTVPAFKKRNLIYGWNYSGKTTISRLFQCLQFPDRSIPYTDGRFTIHLSDGAQATEANRQTQIPVRVFNRDYITANFQAEHTAPAVFIVGEENLALRTRLESLRRAKELLRGRAQERQVKIDRISSADSAAGTARASAVGGLLGVRDFRRPDLETRIREVRNNITQFTLTDEQRQSAIATFQAGNQFSELPQLRHSLLDVAIEISAVNALLRRTATFDAIQGLSTNPELQEWLGRGLALHRQAPTCLFCENPLPPSRLNQLQRHFSTAYQQLTADLEAKISHLSAARFDMPRLDAMQFLQSVRDQVRSDLALLAAWLEYCHSLTQSLVGALQQKRVSLEATLTWDGDVSRLEEGTHILRRLEASIEQHNQQVRNMGTVRRDTRISIERHFAAVHFQEQQLALHEEQIAKLRRQIRYAASADQRLERQAQQISAQIDRAARGAERFKDLVNFLLRGSEIHVESRNEIEFQLKRGTVPAEKLSDGEKTAIAFAYFVTSLQGDGENILNTVVYIDDPISSLDSNHVYAVYALIQERLEAALQLFVSTHNSEFFNLLKGRWTKGALQNDSEAFYVRRMADATGSYSQLERLPSQLRKFGSEYQFIFAQLHAFSTSATPTEFEAYAAPNLLRRFLEAYLGFKKPYPTTWHEKLDMIFDSPEAAREVHRICDDASHLQRLGRALEEPAFVASSQACVRSVLNGILQKDPVHYNSMIVAAL